MRIFLLWQRKDGGDAPAIESVAASLQKLFGGLFASPPKLVTKSVGLARLVWLELPVDGFQAPFYEEQGDAFACASEYPLSARRLLRSRDALPGDGQALRALGEQLLTRPEACLDELVPPFALMTGSVDGAVHLHNDGLGLAQLFEYEDEQIYAVTSRVMALRALSISLQPRVEDWAVRFVAGWFPEQSTGYRGVRYLPGGTRISLTARGVERSRYDPVGKWVHPGSMTREQCLELGRQSLLDYTTDVIELCRKPSVGLSGGWDSRAVVACLRHLGADFDLRVRGSETNFDVMISAELARIAELGLRIKVGGGIPASTVEGCRASIEKALLWQAGAFTTLKHKNFLARSGKDHLDGGVVNIMGQHGGVGKADFAVKIRAHERRAEKYESKLLDKMLAAAPIYLRRDQADHARQVLMTAYRRAAEHELTGLGPLHYFFLNEYTRRWGSATVNSQTGLVVTPLLTPGMIRACYALPPEELPTKPVHRFITDTMAPDWVGFPYEGQATEEDIRSGRIPPVTIAPRRKDREKPLPEWRQVARRHHKFGYRYFWKAVGHPLIDEAFKTGGFWTEIFDPELARKHWLDRKTGGDLIAVAHLLPSVL